MDRTMTDAQIREMLIKKKKRANNLHALTELIAVGCMLLALPVWWCVAYALM